MTFTVLAEFFPSLFLCFVLVCVNRSFAVSCFSCQVRVFDENEEKRVSINMPCWLESAWPVKLDISIYIIYTATKCMMNEPINQSVVQSRWLDDDAFFLSFFLLCFSVFFLEWWGSTNKDCTPPYWVLC